MKHFEFTKWLRAMVIIAAIFSLILYAFVIPLLAGDMKAAHPDHAYMYWPCLIFIWMSAIPLAMIFIQGWKIFKNIEKDNSFCTENAILLKKIGQYSVADCIWFFLGGIALTAMGMIDAGILVSLIVVIVLFFALAITSAALSRLVLKAAKLQDENDLTI